MRRVFRHPQIDAGPSALAIGMLRKVGKNRWGSALAAGGIADVELATLHRRVNGLCKWDTGHNLHGAITRWGHNWIRAIG